MKKIVILIAALILASPGYSQSAKAVAANNEGVEKSNQKDFSGAVENFSSAIKIDPMTHTNTNMIN